MKEKRVFYSELAYAFGILTLAFGTSLMEKAGFGLSMVVAPAYIIHLKVSQYLSFFSFGMSGYVFQAFLLVLLSIVMRKVKKAYLLSFVTAFIFGLVLDMFSGLVGLMQVDAFAWRVAFFAIGLLISTFGITLLLHTYLPPEAYEMVVKELSQKFNVSLSKTKTIYDFCSCALGIALSLSFFKGFVGVQWGTIICTFLNGLLIGIFSKLLEKGFSFKEALPLRDKL